MPIRFLPIATETVRLLRQQTDAYGLPPETVAASSGAGVPCRHCLAQVPKGRPYLVLAHRPFAGLNPFTETGPIFLCADDCSAGGPGFPAAMLTAPAYVTRGYDAEERIVYGTGSVTPTDAVEARCKAL